MVCAPPGRVGVNRRQRAWVHVQVRHGINWEQTLMPAFGMFLKMGTNNKELVLLFMKKCLMKQQKMKFSSSPK